MSIAAEPFFWDAAMLAELAHIRETVDEATSERMLDEFRQWYEAEEARSRIRAALAGGRA